MFDESWLPRLGTGLSPLLYNLNTALIKEEIPREERRTLLPVSGQHPQTQTTKNSMEVTAYMLRPHNMNVHGVCSIQIILLLRPITHFTAIILIY